MTTNKIKPNDNVKSVKVVDAEALKAQLSGALVPMLAGDFNQMVTDSVGRTMSWILHEALHDEKARLVRFLGKFNDPVLVAQALDEHLMAPMVSVFPEITPVRGGFVTESDTLVFDAYVSCANAAAVDAAGPVDQLFCAGDGVQTGIAWKGIDYYQAMADRVRHKVGEPVPGVPTSSKRALVANVADASVSPGFVAGEMLHLGLAEAKVVVPYHSSMLGVDEGQLQQYGFKFKKFHKEDTLVLSFAGGTERRYSLSSWRRWVNTGEFYFIFGGKGYKFKMAALDPKGPVAIVTIKFLGMKSQFGDFEGFGRLETTGLPRFGSVPFAEQSCIRWQPVGQDQVRRFKASALYASVLAGVAVHPSLEEQTEMVARAYVERTGADQAEVIKDASDWGLMGVKAVLFNICVHDEMVATYH